MAARRRGRRRRERVLGAPGTIAAALLASLVGATALGARSVARHDGGTLHGRRGRDPLRGRDPTRPRVVGIRGVLHRERLGAARLERARAPCSRAAAAVDRAGGQPGRGRRLGGEPHLGPAVRPGAGRGGGDRRAGSGGDRAGGRRARRPASARSSGRATRRDVCGYRSPRWPSPSRLTELRPREGIRRGEACLALEPS